MDTSDKDFSETVAHLSIDEFEAFSRLLLMEKEYKVKAKQYDEDYEIPNTYDQVGQGRDYEWKKIMDKK